MAENTSEKLNNIEEDLIQELSARLSVSQAERLDPKFAVTHSLIDEASYNKAAPVPLSSDKTLDIKRVIDVFDHFLSCEATWLAGADSDETVFSCIYFRDPSRLSSHALLHSFFGVARMTYDAVSSVLLYENLENRTIIKDKDFSDGASFQMLEGVEGKISGQLEACKAPLSENRLPEGVQPLQTNPDLEEEFCSAVLCRLRFRKYFYRVLTCLRRTQGEGLDWCKTHIDSCLNELDSILNSEIFLRSRTVSEDRMEHKTTTASGSQPIGFDYQLRRHTVEPRGWKEAITYFQKLLHDLKIICSHCPAPVLEDAFSFVVDFHKFRLLPFARASIQMLVQDGGLYGCEPIFVIIRKAALLPEQANYHDIQKLKSVEELGELLIELLRVLCTDFESQRGELASKIFDWRRILQQLESDFGNKCKNPRKFSTVQYKMNEQACKHIYLWVEEQQLWIGLRYLLLGFDTDAYFPNDYFMVYWYILLIIVNLVNKIMQKKELKNVSVKPKARTKKGGSAYNMDDEPEFPPQVMLLMCYTRVAEGLIAILGVLRNKYKLFIWQAGELVSEEERFSLKFSVFKTNKGWGGVSYEEFKNCTSPSYFSDDALAVLDSFDKALDIARQLRVKYGEVNDEVRLKEVEQLMNVTEGNQKTFNTLRQLGTLDESTKFSFEFDQHPHFAVVTMDGPADLQNLQQLNINAP